MRFILIMFVKVSFRNLVPNKLWTSKISLHYIDIMSYGAMLELADLWTLFYSFCLVCRLAWKRSVPLIQPESISMFLCITIIMKLRGVVGTCRKGIKLVENSLSGLSKKQVIGIEHPYSWSSVLPLTDPSFYNILLPDISTVLQSKSKTFWFALNQVWAKMQDS